MGLIFRILTSLLFSNAAALSRLSFPQTFVAENQPDYDLFFREMGKIGCKVNCVEQSGTAGIDSFQHPMPVQNVSSSISEGGVEVWFSTSRI